MCSKALAKEQIKINNVVIGGRDDAIISPANRYLRNLKL